MPESALRSKNLKITNVTGTLINPSTEEKQNDIIAALGEVVNEKLITDDITTTNVTYVGYAAIATGEASATWKIKKLDETTGFLKIFWADGNANYDNIWTNRATTIVYS